MKTLNLTCQPAAKLEPLVSDICDLPDDRRAIAMGLLDLNSNEVVIRTGDSPATLDEMRGRASMLCHIVAETGINNVFLSASDRLLHGIVLNALIAEGIMVFDHAFGEVA